MLVRVSNQDERTDVISSGCLCRSISEFVILIVSEINTKIETAKLMSH